MSYLHIEYWNSVDLGEVLFQDGFKCKLYLDVEVERPDYNTTIESDLNGENREIPKFKKLEKVWKIPDLYMQEDLLDAFEFMQLCDNIEITLQTGETIVCDWLRVEPSWEEKGCLAKCVVSFAEDYIIGGSCVENMDKSCLCASTTDILGVRTVAALSSLGPSSGEYGLGYTVEKIASKMYIAELYIYTVGWASVPSDAYDCLNNLEDATKWLYDGTYWQLYPGYITALTKPGGQVLITGWAPEGTFVKVWYRVALGAWVDVGDWMAYDLDPGILISPPNGVITVRLEIWNHACNYGYAGTETITLP